MLSARIEKNSFALTSSFAPGIPIFWKSEISATPLLKVTRQVRKLVPPASRTMTLSPSGILCPASLYVGIIARELALPSKPFFISEEKKPSTLSESTSSTLKPWFLRNSFAFIYTPFYPLDFNLYFKSTLYFKVLTVNSFDCTTRFPLLSPKTSKTPFTFQTFPL